MPQNTRKNKKNLEYKLLMKDYKNYCRTIDKKRLNEKIGHMTEADMNKVNKSLLISLGLVWIYNVNKKNINI